MGARLDPLACARLFGVDCMREPRLPIPLDALIGQEAHTMRARLLEAPDAPARRTLLGAWLVARLAPAAGWLPNERELHRDHWRVDALGRRLGLSPRSLHKRFMAELGLGPKLWLQLSRFDALLRHAPHAASLADAAHQFEFAD